MKKVLTLRCKMKIICVGKIKENYLKEAILEYRKRLSKYTTIDLIEIVDQNMNDIKKSLQEEGKDILKQIKDKDYVITLEIEGKNYTSIELAAHLEKLQENHPNLVFVIGGSNGLDSMVKMRANESLSFSSLTFPHQLFRVLLLEQIYRGYKIINHESYHK